MSNNVRTLPVLNRCNDSAIYFAKHTDREETTQNGAECLRGEADWRLRRNKKSMMEFLSFSVKEADRSSTAMSANAGRWSGFHRQHCGRRRKGARGGGGKGVCVCVCLQYDGVCGCVLGLRRGGKRGGTADLLDEFAVRRRRVLGDARAFVQNGHRPLDRAPIKLMRRARRREAEVKPKMGWGGWSN